MNIKRLLTTKRRAPYPSRTRSKQKFYRRYYLVALFFLLSLYILLGSTLFVIDTIEVTGTNFVSKQKIEKQVEDILNKKRWLFFSQKNIFFVNNEDIRASLKSPRVEKIMVKKKPFSTLEIKIIEKIPTAIWRIQNRWYELDKAGVIIDEIVKPENNKLKITDSAKLESSKIGDQVIKPSTLMKIQEIDANLPNLEGLKIREYDVNSEEQYEVELKSTENWILRFSTRNDVSTQMRKLKIFYEEKEREEPGWRNSIEYIDLRFGNTRVYFK